MRRTLLCARALEVTQLLSLPSPLSPHVGAEATGSDAAKYFFTCLDVNSTSDVANWLRGLKKNIRRASFNRSRDAGEKMDQSCTPVYIEQIMNMSKAYQMDGTAEAVTRCFSLVGAQQCAGRSGELAWIVTDNLEWDSHYTCAIAELPMSKPSKMKYVAFVAGVNRYVCFFTALGDSLALSNNWLTISDDPDDADWLFKDLRSTQTPGVKLGTYMKQLMPSVAGGPQSKYQHVSVSGLPHDVSGGGIRPGACNHLASCMPAEVAIHTTGE